MSDYTELCRELRNTERICRDRMDGEVMLKAADAIEQLSNAGREESKPRWIPVTERLPEKTGKYLVCGQWRGKPAETWVCELIAFGKIKGWANEARNPAVTNWMPLPEPPKEETE